MKLDRDVPCMCVHVCVSPTKPFDGPSASLKVSRESASSRAVKKNSAARRAPGSPLICNRACGVSRSRPRGQPDINRPLRCEVVVIVLRRAVECIPRRNSKRRPPTFIF